MLSLRQHDQRHASTPVPNRAGALRALAAPRTDGPGYPEPATRRRAGVRGVRGVSGRESVCGVGVGGVVNIMVTDIDAFRKVLEHTDYYKTVFTIVLNNFMYVF